MKMLLFQAAAFSSSPESEDEMVPWDCPSLVAFIHAEPGDIEKSTRVLRKCAKQIKWLSGKRGIRSVVLHSFAHLSEQKCDPDDARTLIEQLAERLAGSGFSVNQTEFGRSLAWQLTVFQEPLAKVFVVAE